MASLRDRSRSRDIAALCNGTPVSYRLDNGGSNGKVSNRVSPLRQVGFLRGGDAASRSRKLEAMSELAFQSATQLGALIRGGQVSSRELLDQYLERIERLNPAVNAVVTLDVERARARADAADVALRRGEIWGPLHGLPITIKDSIETAGIRTTAGAAAFSNHTPAVNAPSVERLVNAGAIVFGKTNTPYLAGDVQTFNSLFGTTNNPWNVQRTPGGSSGGAAAALAAGLTALDLGSDIGGSIRTPAGWCGVYGHKPSHGIVPLRGHIPGPPGTRSEADLNTSGPLARSAEDLEMMLDIVAGPLEDRAVAWRLEIPPPRRKVLQDYRVAAWLDDAAYPVDDEVAACLQRAVAALRTAGVSIDDSARPAFTLIEAVNTYLRLLFSVVIAGFPRQLFEQLLGLAAELPADADTPIARIARFGTLRHREWLAANEQREHLRARLTEFFRDYDVLLCPVNQVAAIAHDHREPMTDRTIRVNGEPRPYQELFSWIGIATLAWLPATVAPVGRTTLGLPIGVQIVGPYLEDRIPIDFAAPAPRRDRRL